MSIRFAIASDLHVHTSAPSSPDTPSFQSTHPCGAATLQDPLASLTQLIRRENLRADVLLCPGDLGDKADPTATSYAWRALHDLREALHADVLLASAGNHDLDSRYAYNHFDAKGTLLALSPGFPVDHEQLCDQFWARNFCVYDYEPDVRVVIINSCAYHGYATANDATEYMHGRIADSTRLRLISVLPELGHRKFTVILTHHHPMRNDLIDSADYSEMQGGHLLLNALQDAALPNVLFIHGHKHTPRVFYAAGGAAAPVVFSAGSLAAKPFPSMAAKWRNQFYIITVPVEELEGLGLGVVGTVEAWDWSFGTGWAEAGADSAIPYGSGFGCRDNPQHVARRIQMHLGSDPKGYLSWDDLTNLFPNLVYMLPSDLMLIKRNLELNGMRALSAGARVLHQVAGAT